jgi:hypothetical protein
MFWSRTASDRILKLQCCSIASQRHETLSRREGSRREESRREVSRRWLNLDKHGARTELAFGTGRECISKGVSLAMYDGGKPTPAKQLITQVTTVLQVSPSA